MELLGDPSLRRALAGLDAATAGMTPEALAWHPPGKWSSAQVLEHLAKSYATTAYILDKCVNEQRPVGKPPSIRQRLFTTMVVSAGYLPTGVEAPAITRPDGLPPLEALASARASLQALDRAAARCAAHFGRRVRVANHPLLGGFTTAQWQRFHWIHTRHHLKQIAGLRRGAARETGEDGAEIDGRHP